MYDLKIRVLVENVAGGRELLAEHGLSFLIELGNKKYLFDAGQGLALCHNAQRLGIRLNSVDGVVLSHGHYDHTGGLRDALDQIKDVPVFTQHDAFEAKYARNPDGTGRDVGMDESVKAFLRDKADIHWVDRPTQIMDGLWCTGPIPRTNDYEDTGGAFFKDKDCIEPDAIKDDQAVYIETGSGTIVVSGCAHAGIINTLNYIRTLTGGSPIRAVIGGMHLLNANPRRMESTITELRRLKIERLMPCHCTGFTAMARLWSEFPEQYETIRTGSIIRFESR